MKTKRRKKENCKYFDGIDPFISCDHPRLLACVCVKVCKDYESYVKPLIEKT